MIDVTMSDKELRFLLALLDCDRQTALQLLAAEYAYKPTLVPKFQQALKRLKSMKALD
jgi:hypothetical protein